MKKNPAKTINIFLKIYVKKLSNILSIFTLGLSKWHETHMANNAKKTKQKKNTRKIKLNSNRFP